MRRKDYQETTYLITRGIYVKLGVNITVKIYLKRASKRPHWSFCSMCTEPRCVAPHELPIATSMNFAATKSKLHIPHIRIHLPQDKSTRLCSFGGIPTTCDFVSSLKLGRYHPHLSHCISIVN